MSLDETALDSEASHTHDHASGSGSGNSTSGTGSPSTASLDAMARYLTHGYFADTNQGRGTFDTDRDNTLTVNITALTGQAKQLARWSFEVWETVADLNFVETGSTNADITFDDNRSGAYAASSSINGNTVSAQVNVSSSWVNSHGGVIDGYAMATYIHEIGHALGLGHQGHYNGDADFDHDADFADDSRQLSIQSYFEPDENPNTNGSNANVISAQMVDIIAIQNLYGAPGASSATAGRTIWGANTNLDGYWSHLDAMLTGTRIPGIYDGDDVALTIYDRNGIDTLNLSTSTTDDTINMRWGTFSDVGGLTGNLAIARGTMIEFVTTGSGDDTVTGNNVTNRIITGDGDDIVHAERGWDKVWTGKGNDHAFGGRGDDLMGGMDGFDTLSGGEGNDTLFGGGWADTVGGGNGNDLIYGDRGSDQLWGNNGKDTLDGGLHDDTVNGGSQADRVYGGWGNDLVNGGRGNDIVAAGRGDDLAYGGHGSDTVRGGDGNDRVFGGAGYDRLYGGAGNDILWGEWGKDTVAGGTGADTFVFAARGGRDVITDFDAGQGDVLRLNDNLWTSSHGNLSASAVVSTFGSTQGGNLTLRFDGGEVLTLNNVTSLTDALEIV
jgi:serralysin